MAVLIDGFRIDLAKAEIHTYQNDITTYPVEEGSDKTDHIIQRQFVLVVESVHSDTPVVSTGATAQLPSEACLAKLRELYVSKEPVSVSSSLGLYESMALESLVIPRDVSTGRALRFTATFRQIDLVTNERTTIEVAVPQAANKKNRGHKDPDKVEYTSTEDLPTVETHFDGKPIGRAKIDPATYYRNETPIAKKMRAGRIPVAVGGGETPKGAGLSLGDLLAKYPK